MDRSSTQQRKETDNLCWNFSLSNFEIYGACQEKYFVTLRGPSELLISEFWGLRKKRSGLLTNLTSAPKSTKTSVNFVGCFLELICTHTHTHTYILIYCFTGKTCYIHYKSHSTNIVEGSKVFLIWGSHKTH